MDPIKFDDLRKTISSPVSIHFGETIFNGESIEDVPEFYNQLFVESLYVSEGKINIVIKDITVGSVVNIDENSFGIIRKIDGKSFIVDVYYQEDIYSRATSNLLKI